MAVITKLEKNRTVFDEFEVLPVINCCGIYTDLGGSILSPDIMRAIEELNSSYVRITDLLDSAGRIIADLVGAEAARVTPGCSAALALSVAATMAGDNGEFWEQLPDTTGMKDELLISKAHFNNYKYLQPARLSGCKTVQVGADDHFDLDEMIGAITDNTACILIPAHLLDGFSGVEKLTEVCLAAHAANVPVVVDAAFLSFPISLLRSFAESGADLTCFSAKYFFGPNSGGFVSGNGTLIAAIEGLDFTRYETGRYRTVGRAFKMSRYDIAATALALREWTSMDHDLRWRSYRDRVGVLESAASGVEGPFDMSPAHFTLDERVVYGDIVNALEIRFHGGPAVATAMADRLEQESPMILAVVEAEKLVLAVDAMQDGEEKIVAPRLRSALAGEFGAQPG
jgi:L-seryl-tRNA(Ser) seleniumtransferase